MTEVLLNIGLPHAVDDGILIMAELVNNAVAVTPPGGIIRLFAGPRMEGIVMAVWDADDRIPKPGPPPAITAESLDLRPENFDRNGGWGLGIVATLARECWIERTRPGKWVCASLDA
ncbi:hypothetical protein DPM19_07865 [Actinomadura craniellae]|uniref:Histidine kinase/HSP90-like ATPase domain-containing protein n=1 Tax=Actinomadura craniellae TaxID=2231787 RepID=A0A365H9D8_9ACTN|nr:hypothetical protein DPM19_07865 [Actinomadura craniellae]